MKDRGVLRVLNAVVSVLMMAGFLVHGVGNAFQMAGVGTPLPTSLSWGLVVLCVVHAGIGLVLTLDTLRSQREAGVSYVRSNLRFWAVRASGFALALLVLAHVLIFLKPTVGALRLPVFQSVQLALSLALVLALAVHVLANIEPMLVSLGVPAPSERAFDLLIAVALLLALMGAGFVVYFLRWSVI